MGAQSPLIIGVGNDSRRDDGVGPWVAKKLIAAGVPARIESGEGASLMAAWEVHRDVIVIDAAKAGGEPGTLYRFQAHDESLPTGFFHYSTHQFGLAEAVETARHLGDLPENLSVIAVEGADFGWGAGLSEPVAIAAETVYRELLQGQA